MSTQSDPFEASAAAVGYLYQFRKALLFCVEQLETGLDWSVAVEAGDDVEVQRDEGAGWWQLKHRAPGTRMTDASTDLWKSLRIWSDAVAKQRLDLDQTDLFLLTTAVTPEGTAGYHLRPPGIGNARDEAKALGLLESTRSTSTNKTNKAAYAAWDALDGRQRRSLLARIQVLDRGPDIEETGAHLSGRAVLAVGHDKAQSFLQRLDGWFVERVIQQFRDPTAGPITGAEFDEVFTDRRNQFRPDNLPSTLTWSR
jgi:hypothetical protein